VCLWECGVSLEYLFISLYCVCCVMLIVIIDYLLKCSMNLYFYFSFSLKNFVLSLRIAQVTNERLQWP